MHVASMSPFVVLGVMRTSLVVTFGGMMPITVGEAEREISDITAQL
jgi:hypothetical protein